MSTRNICHRTSSSTTKQFHIHKNTNNKDICNINNKLFMILYNCNFMMCFIQDFCLGVGLRVYFARSGIFSFITGRLCSCCLITSSQSLFTIGSVTAYTSGPSSTFCKKINHFQISKLNEIYIYIAKQLSPSQYSYK